MAGLFLKVQKFEYHKLTEEIEKYINIFVTGHVMFNLGYESCL